MSPLFALFLLGAVWTAQCNVVGTMVQGQVLDTVDYEDGVYDSIPDKLALDDEDGETELDNYLDVATGDLAEMEDEFNVNDLLSDPNLEQMLSACVPGRCSFCYSRRVFRKKVELCATGVFSRSSVKITLSAKVNSKGVFRKEWTISSRNFTIPIPKAILPPIMRPLLRGRAPIKIELTNIEYRKRKFCVRIRVTLRIPRRTLSSPRKCF